MKNRLVWAGVLAAITVGVALGVNYTKQSYVAMTNSLIDSTPIGNTTPSNGKFSHFTLSGGAPAGMVLTGNGSEYLPAKPTTVVTTTQVGCLFPAWNNLVHCNQTFAWIPAFPDANYDIIGCFASTPNAATVAISQENEGSAKNKDGFAMGQTLLMINGAGSGWRPNVTCAAVHR